MRSSNLSLAMILLAVIITAGLCGCSEQHPDFGKWKTKTETHEYVLLTARDAQALGKVPPGPFPADNKQGWTRVKEVRVPPENIKPTLKPYSVVAIEQGFSFLQSTKITAKETSYQDIEWGWKVVLENRSKRGVHAYGGYSLLDKDGFALAATGTDWDNNESGVLINPGERATIQGKAVWRIAKATKPYPPFRVVGGDYKLFLRHDVFERLADEIKQKNR